MAVRTGGRQWRVAVRQGDDGCGWLLGQREGCGGWLFGQGKVMAWRVAVRTGGRRADREMLDRRKMLGDGC